MGISAEYLEYVLEQLAQVGTVSSRRMFGGVGLYSESRFFALIARDVLYFKVDDGNRTLYESRGMQPFRPFEDRPQLSMSYYEVPAEVLEDPQECAAWARRSIALAAVKIMKKNVKGKKR